MQKRNLVTIMAVLLLSFGIVAQVGAQVADRDGDGVPDTADRCPSDAGPASNNGCPVNNADDDDDSTSRPDDVPDDSDGDGTADPLDSCPERPGDGANGGCPEGVDPNNPDGSTEEVPVTSPEFELQVAPPSEDCIVSPNGNYSVNMRVTPSPTADIVHVLEPNEWAVVYAIAYEGEDPFRAEHEFGGMMQPLGIAPPPLDPDPTPDPVDPDEESLWLLVETEDGFIGWVAELVIRYAGDCDDIQLPENDPQILEVLILPNDGGGIEIPADNGFLSFPTNPGPDPLPPLVFDVRLPEEGSDDSLDFAPECILVDLGGGASILECADGSTPMFTYCIVEPGAEAGMFVENCYEVEVPEGCIVTTPEVGVWHMECEEDDDGVTVRPMIEGAPILNVRPQGGGILIGLLLPAVQQ